MVGLGNKYPKQLLNSTVHKVLFSEASRFEASVLQMAPSDTDSTSSWIASGKKIPRSEIVFLCQVLILYTVIVVRATGTILNSGFIISGWKIQLVEPQERL
jgi:hypothetical protein